MTRRDKAWLLELSIKMSHYCYTHRLFSQVSLRQTPAYIPEGWADCLHLDMVIMPMQRKSSSIPFQCIGLEIKSCRADFHTDKKWERYMHRVDALAFVTFPGVIKPKELPEGVGLWEVSFNEVGNDMGKYILPSINYARHIQYTSVEDIARFDLMYGLAICENRYLRKEHEDKCTKQFERLAREYIGIADPDKKADSVSGSNPDKTVGILSEDIT